MNVSAPFSVGLWPFTRRLRRGTILNFPMQANGAEMMRLAAIAAYETGIQICAPAHDAFWIMAPLSELTDTIEAMTKIMERAAFTVAGLHIPVEVAAVVRWPQCLGDVRHQRPREPLCGPKSKRCWVAANCRKPRRRREKET